MLLATLLNCLCLCCGRCWGVSEILKARTERIGKCSERISMSKEAGMDSEERRDILPLFFPLQQECMTLIHLTHSRHTPIFYRLWGGKRGHESDTWYEMEKWGCHVLCREIWEQRLESKVGDVSQRAKMRSINSGCHAVGSYL